MGSIYKRKNSNNWWIRYYKDGKIHRESSGSTKISVARTLLKKVDGRLAEREDPGILFCKSKYEDLERDIINDYEIQGHKSRDRLKFSLQHLSRYFSGINAAKIDTSMLRDYIKNRMKEGASNGTINRELSALRRMLTLAFQCEKIARVPYFPMQKESEPRQGYFDHSEYLELLKNLPSYLVPVVSYTYWTGCRKSEVLGLRWDNVNLKERWITLNPDQTKNGKTHQIYITDELLKILKIQNMRRRKRCNYVFHRNGLRIKDFRTSWKNACKKAGLEGKLFHDLRRTMVTDSKEAGLSDTASMKITGHKTPAVHRNYIQRDRRIIESGAKAVEQHRLCQACDTISGTVGENQKKAAQGHKAQIIEFPR